MYMYTPLKQTPGTVGCTDIHTCMRMLYKTVKKVTCVLFKTHLQIMWDRHMGKGLPPCKFRGTFTVTPTLPVSDLEKPWGSTSCPTCEGVCKGHGYTTQRYGYKLHACNYASLALLFEELPFRLVQDECSDDISCKENTG